MKQQVVSTELQILIHHTKIHEVKHIYIYLNHIDDLTNSKITLYKDCSITTKTCPIHTHDTENKTSENDRKKCVFLNQQNL